MTKQRKQPVHKPAEPIGVLWGYARVSTDEQDLALQIEALARAGVERENIFTDKRSGKDLKRGGLLDMLELARRGDVIVVWRFDRLSRSLRDLLQVFDGLSARGVHLRSLHEQLDTTTPMGKLMFQLAGMLAEFERNIIAARTSAGMQTARANGRRFGPQRKLTERDLDRAIKWLQPRSHLRGQVEIMAAKISRARGIEVSAYTLRNRVRERLGGKRLWPKGPRSKQ